MAAEPVTLAAGSGRLRPLRRPPFPDISRAGAGNPPEPGDWRRDLEARAEFATDAVVLGPPPCPPQS